jgi:hypothetical protein
VRKNDHSKIRFYTLWLLLGLLGLWLLLLPPEQSLGHVIKVVYIHAALVQTGLIIFSIAGVFGLSYIVFRKQLLFNWCLASQKTAVVIWTAYILSSMVATYFAWGVIIAWDEPRVISSLQILIFAILFLLLAIWIKQKLFIAVINFVMALLAWILTKRAIPVRHPLDPIGSSNSIVLKFFYIAIFLTILLISFQICRLFLKGIRSDKIG